MGEFLIPLINVVIELLNLYWWLVLISVVVSWLVALHVINTYNRNVATVCDLLYRATEPALRPIRRLLPNLGGLDLSPIIVLGIIYVLMYWLQLSKFYVRGI